MKTIDSTVYCCNVNSRSLINCHQLPSFLSTQIRFQPICFENDTDAYINTTLQSHRLINVHGVSLSQWYKKWHANEPQDCLLVHIIASDDSPSSKINRLLSLKV